MSGPTELLLVSAAIVAIGFVAAAIARILLRGQPGLGWAASTLCGIAGAVIGSTGTALVLGRPLVQAPGWGIVGGLVGTVLIIAAGDAVARRRRPAPTPVVELMRNGESERVEFKSSARYNLHTGARDAKLELVIARAVAGFLNARGGTLLIGVSDDGSAVGLASDYALVKSAGRDGYELWLRDLLSQTLGVAAVAEVVVRFEAVGEHDVCAVFAPPARHPVFLRAPKQQATEFPVRVGNSTRVLAAHELLDYATGRWRRRALIRRR
jgi:uncharacterized membrane protein YeaQ/YmgE (transglycosylase-associated protein family)